MKPRRKSIEKIRREEGLKLTYDGSLRKGVNVEDVSETIEDKPSDQKGSLRQHFARLVWI